MVLRGLVLLQLVGLFKNEVSFLIFQQQVNIKFLEKSFRSRQWIKLTEMNNCDWEAYLGPSETSMKELFTNIVNG